MPSSTGLPTTYAGAGTRGIPFASAVLEASWVRKQRQKTVSRALSSPTLHSAEHTWRPTTPHPGQPARRRRSWCRYYVRHPLQIRLPTRCLTQGDRLNDTVLSARLAPNVCVPPEDRPHESDNDGGDDWGWLIGTR